MGFPVSYSEVFLPKLFIYILSFLGFIRNLILSIFRFLGISEYFLLEPEVLHFQESPTTQTPENPPVSAVLIRELLPVVKFEDLAGEQPESCAVCLYDLECGEEIRWLANCKHIFHRGCLDRWMDHDQTTCPLCRTPFVPRDLQDEFNQRLWAASGITDFYSDYNTISGL